MGIGGDREEGRGLGQNLKKRGGLSNIGGRVGGLHKTGEVKIPLPTTLICRVLQL